MGMAFKLLVVATLVAIASAGMDPKYMMQMMEMMNSMEKEKEMKVPVGNGGCTGGACQVPAGVDIQTYMEQQKQAQKMPYEAASLKEAKERIFGGMLYSICTALGTYMDFATQVENNINLLQPNPVTAAPGK